MQATRCEKCGKSFHSAEGCQACLLQMGLSNAGAGVPIGGELPTISELNRSFPQLEITRLIGRGGMGAIYQARQTSLDRDVALKLIAKEVSQDPTFVERFEREAKTLAKLSHPNIVTIYDFGYTTEGVAYLIMEFVDGINLREAMKSQSVGPEDALDVVATICRALEYAHSRGIIHRDIKPENILLGEDGCLKVVDFGIAKIVDDSVRTPTLTATRQVLGSLHYLAPEQLESPDQVDHRVDLYALGVVFYELLTGELPLGRYEPPSAIFKRADKRLDNVVLKSLSRKPVNRFQTAREFGAEIQSLQASSAPQSAELPPPLPSDSVAAHSPGSVSFDVPFTYDLPFTYDTYGGLAEAIGMLCVKDRTLYIEFRIRDKLMGVLKTKAQLIQIPFEKLTRLELVSGVFSSKLIVCANSLNALSDLPNAETGTAQFQVKNRDAAMARKLVEAAGFKSPNVYPFKSMAPEFGSKEYINQAVFGALMVLCAIMNFGSLAIAQIVNANSAHSNPATLACVAISIAVILGPIALIQLVGGIMNFAFSMRPFNGVLTVVSMIPISPIWFISFPAAIWASPWLRGEEANVSTSSKQAWGATTLMFIRESRWSKVVAVANALGLVLVASLSGMYVFGYYPNSVVFRVSAGLSSLNSDEVISSVRARLVDAAPAAAIAFDQATGRITVRDWQRNGVKVQSALAVQSQLQLAWLVLADSTQTDNNTWLPLAGKLPTEGLAERGQGMAKKLATSAPLIELKPELIAGVKAAAQGLTLVPTSSGRELLSEARPDTKEVAIGLVVGGMVEGIARGEEASSKRIRFELCEQSDLGAASIEAALRGPALPFSLELIEE